MGWFSRRIISVMWLSVSLHSGAIGLCLLCDSDISWPYLPAFENSLQQGISVWASVLCDLVYNSNSKDLVVEPSFPEQVER